MVCDLKKFIEETRPRLTLNIRQELWLITNLTWRRQLLNGGASYTHCCTQQRRCGLPACTPMCKLGADLGGPAAGSGWVSSKPSAPGGRNRTGSLLGPFWGRCSHQRVLQRRHLWSPKGTEAPFRAPSSGCSSGQLPNPTDHSFTMVQGGPNLCTFQVKQN